MIEFYLVVALGSALLFLLYKYLMQKSRKSAGGLVENIALRDGAVVFLATYGASYLASRYLPKGGPPAQAFLDTPSF